MPLTATVIESFPERRSGYLERPEGGEKVYFDSTGWRKKKREVLVNADCKAKSFPPPGSKVEIVELEKSTTGYPQATLWRLVERGKLPQISA